LEYGKWSNSIQAFWCGGMDAEYIAWKGSHQIFIYPCKEEYPNSPSHVIQHKNRIETEEDFDEAMKTGIRYKCSITVVGVGAFSAKGEMD
jgi:hypothetical protein